MKNCTITVPRTVYVSQFDYLLVFELSSFSSSNIDTDILQLNIDMKLIVIHLNLVII